MPEKRLLADEHIAKSVVRRLESYGINADHIDEIDMKGESDHEIIKYAEKNGYIILTQDDDFKDLISKENSFGLIFLTKRMRKKETAAEIMKVFNSMSIDEIRGEVIHIPW